MSGPNKRSDAYSNIFARPLPSTHQNPHPHPSPAPPAPYAHAPDRHSPQAYPGAYYPSPNPAQLNPARVVSGASTHSAQSSHSADSHARYYPDPAQGYRQHQNYAQELTYGAPHPDPDPRQHYDPSYGNYQQPQRNYQSSIASDRSPALSSQHSFISNDSYPSTSSGPTPSSASSSYYPYPPASSIPASLTPAYPNGSSLENSPANSPRSPIVPLPKLPPRLPEMTPLADDFLGFESSRRDSDSYSLGARSRTTSSNVPPPQFYDGGPIGEEADGFDQYGSSNGYRTSSFYATDATGNFC